ncbi:fumarylacetoacetate hydrolase family protein [Gordonia rhizosphera NBRC 16068]|uniref:Fumarylacetoacetate hydrolase family protein n=2 Tax=Gordonia rhizosphera TaxID=83341 RepID=K6VRN9_9ACTN|nr:fumarylacetoacetate hydrolase family protein [Gordonia rhizosphera NBRC 16068]
MRFATVRTPDGPRVLMDRDGTVVQLPFASLRAALEAGVHERADSFDGCETVAGPVDLAPVVADPGKIICVGHNYRAHILEMGHPLPEVPNVFSKFATALVGPQDPITLWSESTDWDWEAELALVIGRRVHGADMDEARAAIAGYTVANDISARDWQRRTSQWLLGKTFDTTTPVGPWLVSPDEVDHAADLEITCTVDGQVVQRSSTADLLFGPAELVSYLSTVMTLHPGDLVLTGTPAGVGAGRDPQVFLRAGQTVQTEIAGLGACANECVARAGRQLDKELTS